jgi:hypothetical protein
VLWASARGSFRKGGRDEAVAATVVAIANPRYRIATSYPEDTRALVVASGQSPSST